MMISGILLIFFFKKIGFDISPKGKICMKYQALLCGKIGIDRRYLRFVMNTINIFIDYENISIFMSAKHESQYMR